MRKLPSAIKCRGIAAVELAIIAPILVIMMFAAAEFGRCLYHYAAAHGAAWSAARYMSQVPEEVIRSYTKVAYADQLARVLVDANLDGLENGSVLSLVDVQCDGLVCGGTGKPQKVRVAVRLRIQNTYFPARLPEVWLVADVAMAYTGR